MFSFGRLSVWLVCVGFAAGLQASELWSTEGFANPESVEYDAVGARLFVSNVDGQPTDANGKGFISLLQTDGTMKQARWVAGLNAPKGLVLHQDILYVADIDELVAIDVEQGKILARHKAAGARFLNDVDATEDGRVFVTDMATQAIYVLSGDTLDLWLRDEALQHPNGLRVEGDRLVLASWGQGMQEDMSTTRGGHLLAVDLATKTVATLGSGEPIGYLDGLVPDGHGQWLASDWVAGAIYRIHESGSAETLLDLDQGSADIEIMMQGNERVLIVPMMMNNTVVAYPLP